MTVKVIRSPAYLEDLVAIWDFHAAWSAESADRILGEIEAKVTLLGQFPDLGERCPQYLPDARRTLADRYVIYYRRLEDHVRVLRVRHGAERFDKPEK